MRYRARIIISELLGDFRSKRLAGLGNIFGPPDHVLQETMTNKVREMAIVEELLVPYIESLRSELQ